MQKWLAKQGIKIVLRAVNMTAKKYLSYETGLSARAWVEAHILDPMAVWSRKSTKLDADDGLVAFFRGMLKSNKINDAVHYVEMESV